MDLTRELTIADLGGGAILERLEFELKEVIDDCFNVNKVADSAREISCKLKIKPDKYRSFMEITIQTGNKLGQRHPIEGKAFMDDETKTVLEPKVKESEQDMFDNSGNIAIIGGRMDR